jgi:thiamine-phosphate pyrophosphorylase
VILPDPPVLVITDRRQARMPLEGVAEAVFAGGCRWLSLREKDLDGETRQSLLRRLVGLGRAFGALVMVHEDLEAALAAAAAGLHLPSSGAVLEARRRLGGGALIGRSAHDQSEVWATSACGADYATLSPIFASASKPGYGPPLGLAGLASVAAATNLAIIAQGGIDETNAAACLRAGAAGIAVMGRAMVAADPARFMAALIKTLPRGLAAP